jgi:hypothetical protein
MATAARPHIAVLDTSSHRGGASNCSGPDGPAVGCDSATPQNCSSSETAEIVGEKASQRPRNEPQKEFPKSYPAPARKGGIETQGVTEAKPKKAVLSEISAPCVRMHPGAEEAEKPEYPRQGSKKCHNSRRKRQPTLYPARYPARSTYPTTSASSCGCWPVCRTRSGWL